MSTKYPDYTRTFTEVYLKELDYVAERRKQMKLTYGEVEKELQQISERIPQESVKEIPDAPPQTGVLGILEKFNAKILIGLLGFLTIITLWFSFSSEISIGWDWFLIFTAWILWFLFFKLKFQSLLLGITTTCQSPPLNIKKPNTDAALVGLALSGGGVRSSTFNLGLLQSLAKHKVLRYCDYLSTVSGGGYIGSCLSSLLADTPQASTQSKTFPLRDEPDGELEERAEVNYLRKTKNYLGVGGIFNQDTWHMVGTMLSSMLLTITMPLAILLTIISILYGFNSLEENTQEIIQIIIPFFIIILSLWVVIIRLRQVIFHPFEWFMIWLEGLLFMIFFVSSILLIFTFFIPSLEDILLYNRFELLLLVLLLTLPFLMTSLFWWAEITRCKIASQLTKKLTGKTKTIVTIFLESIIIIIFWLSFFLPFFVFFIEQKQFFYFILLFGGGIFSVVLLLRIFCQKCFQRVENILELDKRISFRAFMVGFLLALMLLLGFVQYLTNMFIEVQVNPETTFYITTHYLFAAFILTLIIGHFLANKANKLIQKSIKMLTATISIVLIFTFSASLLADVLLQKKFGEAKNIVNNIHIGIVDLDGSRKEILQDIDLHGSVSNQLRFKVNKNYMDTFTEIDSNSISDNLNDIHIKLNELKNRQDINDSLESENEVKKIDIVIDKIIFIKEIEKLKQGWENLIHLLIWKGEKRVKEITTRICDDKCRNSYDLIHEQNSSANTGIKTLLPEYSDFFKLGNLPAWNPSTICDAKEVQLLIQLREKVEAEKHWQMQRTKTLQINEISMLIELFTGNNFAHTFLKFKANELDRWLEAIYTIAFYQCDNLDLRDEMLKVLNSPDDKVVDNDIHSTNFKLSNMVILAIFVLILLGLLTNINHNSLHDFYRTRLSRTYLIKRIKEMRMESNSALRLTDIHNHYNGPYHLINTTLNVPTSEKAQLQGRGADFFIFSKYYCGSESTGYRSTKTYSDGKFELAAAMAISGAAASPGMGTNTNPIMAFWMTMLNVRLNLWVLNPNLQQKPKLIIWPFYLAKEFFMQGKTDDTLLNLSDGGHHENLGIYPLLKRRCKVIIASDAGADPNFEMADLANLQRKARIDLGINIEFDLSDLRPDPNNNGYTKTYFVQGTITYPKDENGNSQTGTLFYIKTAMVGDEPEDLLAYRRTHPTFPDETTADQFFNEDQFESYRKLGELAGSHLEGKASLAEYIEKTCSCQEINS
ncbi:MAG: patatin-like phospholipase family protein [Candidatus Marithrix sp.]|nr:patatin-like phospholipase family protein [Candidatus Marithrix sp.]